MHTIPCMLHSIWVMDQFSDENCHEVQQKDCLR